MLITAHLKKGEITTTTVTLDGVLWAHPVTSAENNVPVKKKKTSSPFPLIAFSFPGIVVAVLAS